jgi:hypothetical protein
MKALSEQLRGKAHWFRSEEAKRSSRACHVPSKNHFYRHVIRGWIFEPQIFYIRVSDAPIRPYSSHNLKMYHYCWYVFTKTWKGQLHSYTATGRDNGTPASGYNFFTCQFTFKSISCPRHRIICEKLCPFQDLLILVSVQLSDAHNPLWQSRFHKKLRYWLQSIRPFLNHICVALKVKLSLWNFQQKFILLHIKIFYLLFNGNSNFELPLFNGNSKSPASIRADECFWPLPVIDGDVSVQTIKSGLECGQWLLRKLRITVLM